MEEKIFEKLKEEERKSATKYEKAMGNINEEDKISQTIPKKNFDLKLILSNVGLIEDNEESLEKINDFHDYLFKLGIDIGISHGKQLIIHAIKADRVDIDRIMTTDLENYINFNFMPSYLYDLKEALLNEK